MSPSPGSPETPGSPGSPGYEPTLPRMLGNGFGLASMLSTRSIATVRHASGVHGTVEGLGLQDIVRNLEQLPSRSWVADDLTVVHGQYRLRFHAAIPSWLVRVDGPVEARDGRDIRAAITRGDDPLAFELRADLYLAATRSGVSFSTNDDRIVLEIAATLLQHHAAAAVQRAVTDVTKPEFDVVAALLGASGLALRGLETDVFPGFLDIGVSDAEHEAPPAMRCVVLDRVTGAWHTD